MTGTPGVLGQGHAVSRGEWYTVWKRVLCTLWGPNKDTMLGYGAPHDHMAATGHSGCQTHQVAMGGRPGA